MPKYAIAIPDMPLATNQIKVDIRERINALIRETNHAFALDNYEYLQNVHMNESIAKIYK